MLRAVARSAELIREKEDIYKERVRVLESEISHTRQEGRDRANQLFHEK